MENRIINIAVVAEVAAVLKTIEEQIVFVGGAVVSLYADDPAAFEIRPTQDVDITINVINLGHWVELQEKLSILGFHPDPQGYAIWSYKYKDIPVDIMSAEDGPLGPANRWYKIGFQDVWTVNAHEQVVKIVSAPCFLATKFEAYNNWGSDYRTSHDIEDIIYVLDNRTTIVSEIQHTEKEIKKFLIEQLKVMIQLGILEEVLMTHIHPLMLEERMPIVMEKIENIIGR